MCSGPSKTSAQYGMGGSTPRALRSAPMSGVCWSYPRARPWMAASCPCSWTALMQPGRRPTSTPGQTSSSSCTTRTPPRTCRRVRHPAAAAASSSGSRATTGSSTGRPHVGCSNGAAGRRSGLMQHIRRLQQSRGTTQTPTQSPPPPHHQGRAARLTAVTVSNPSYNPGTRQLHR
jgi:hypothetical protein